MRAVMANPQLFLTPGVFGSMRLASGAAALALLIPDEAVQTDQTRKTVLTVAPDGTVVVKVVELGPIFDGLRVVRSGLRVSDQVIVGGLQNAIPGTKVQIKTKKDAILEEELKTRHSSDASISASTS